MTRNQCNRQTPTPLFLLVLLLMIASRSRGRATAAILAGPFREMTFGCAAGNCDTTPRKIERHRPHPRPFCRRTVGAAPPVPLRTATQLQRLRGGGARSSSTSLKCEEDTPRRRAFLAVGSNLGDRYRNIASALASLESDSRGAIRIVRTSHLRTTAPMYVTDQPEFLNGAVEVETTLTPIELLRAIKRAEAGRGRDVGTDSGAVRFGPREVDLDILLFDGDGEAADPDGTADFPGESKATLRSLVLRTAELEIPHPRMLEREFVLSPLHDLETEARRIVHPASDRSMSDLLDSLMQETNRTATNSTQDGKAVRVLPLPRGRMLRFNKTIVMGILNVTPDSFSDGGKYSASVESAARQALQMERDGAGIIDVGGESTRPGAEDVGVAEELARAIPVVARIRALSDIPISIDTRNAAVAAAAVEAGADVVNDVSGGTHDPEMLSRVAEMGVPMVIMHMRGDPRTMTGLTDYDGEGGVVRGVAEELGRRSAAAEAAGVPRWLQVLDPGIGFAKDLDGNLELLRGADGLGRSCGGLPLLYGPSRKGFIGRIAEESDPEQRDYGTIAACLALLRSGDGCEEACMILRVHNVKAVKQAVLVYEAILNAGKSRPQI